MLTKRNASTRDAKHGQKVIEARVRFWTDAIAAEPGRFVPKHAWTSGVVRMERNAAHRITPSAPGPFNSLPELSVAIEKTLLSHGINLHPSRKMKKYITQT
jgi:hypothetical protein